MARGTVCMRTNGVDASLSDVAYAKYMPMNLLLVAQLYKKGLRLNHNDNGEMVLVHHETNKRIFDAGVENDVWTTRTQLVERQIGQVSAPRGPSQSRRAPN